MSRTSTTSVKDKQGLELFSDMMLMKFKPKSLEGGNKARQSESICRQLLGNSCLTESHQEQQKQLANKMDKILYLQLASNDTVVLGNYNQLDMFDLDGLTHGFIDTYHYWSFCPNTPIMNFKVNMKKQMMMIYSLKNIFIYTYEAKKLEQKIQPLFVASIQLKDEIISMQFPTTDLISLFYGNYFEIYSFNDSYLFQKKLEKKYNVQSSKFTLFSVPQGIDSTINIFFEEKIQKASVFGLWCIEVNLYSGTIKQNQPYKIYDIQKSLKNQLQLKNYSKEFIVLSLGQEILVASKGYIVDSANINIQLDNAYLKLIPQRRILLHIQENYMEVYQFKINTAVLPNRIELNSLDSIEISGLKSDCKLIDALPILDNNYALFYEMHSTKTTKGEIFYQFMMSYTVKLSQKINKILNLNVPLSEMSDQRLDRKCDVLRKIGLKDDQIYLELWKRSTQATVQDYQFLLSTRSYKIIKSQIQSKMKKTSMRFKELIKIEESCLQILKSKITVEECQVQNIEDYLTSHLLLRKLRLFKEIQLIVHKELIEKERSFQMNIQEYYTFKNLKPKQFVVEKIGAYLTTGVVTIQEVRTILHHFRFIYRHVYHELLEDIIKEAKADLPKLLIGIPELLPIQVAKGTHNAFEDGMWSTISSEQWQQSLYYEKIACLYNKEIVDEVIKSVWFKRNWLIMHDFVPISNADIIEKDKKNNSVEIFYFFIEKAFENIKDQSVLKDLMRYLENTYQKFPKHIRNKVLLYYRLYCFYQQYHELIREPKMQFSAFLPLLDHQLFKYFFGFQKIKKGCLLRQIREIYLVTISHGQEAFNSSLLNYFKSDISELSHLKYLLNRINNEKRQFHSTHESMYAILVKAMQRKLRIGSENDIPIDQVLIYLQNIPITSNSSKQIIEDLQIIQKISDQYQTLNKMKLNMTIRQIIKNYDNVMQKMVDYEFQKYKIFEINDQKQLISTIYRVLAQIQSLKKNLYGRVENQLAFFILLTKLMEKEEKIMMAKVLLADQYINNYFYIDEKIIQNLVRYMYHWKFSQNSSFIQNESYIRTLLKMVAEGSQIKEFIQNQLKFALLLSTNKQPVRYPLSILSQYPRGEDLEQIIRQLDKQVLKTINIQEVIDTMRRLKQLSSVSTFEAKPSHFEGIQSLMPSNSHIDNHSMLFPAYNQTELKPSSLNSMLQNEIKDEEIFYIFIKCFILKGLIRQALVLIRHSVQSSESHDIITVLILAYHILPEINEESRLFLVKIISFLYEHPMELLVIVEKIVNEHQTTLAVVEFLRNQYRQIRQKYLNYNPENIIFNVYFLHTDDESEKEAKKQLVKNTLIKLKKTKIQFKFDRVFDLLYIILCHCPESIAVFLKFVKIGKSKLIRSFFSHLIMQDIFDEVNVLEVMKRAYYFLLKSFKFHRSVYSVVQKYKDISLVEEFRLKNYDNLNEIEKKISKNIKAYETKKNKVLSREGKQKMKYFLKLDKAQSIKDSMQNPDNTMNKQINQYVFSDSDDDYKNAEEQNNGANMHNVHQKQEKAKFNKAKERQDFYKYTPIRSRKELMSPKKQQTLDSPEKNRNQGDLMNPIDVLGKSIKMKKYFSKDVRSHYDPTDILIEESMGRSNENSINKKKSHGYFQPKSSAGEISDQKSAPGMAPKIKTTGSLKEFMEVGDRSFEVSSDHLFVDNKKSTIQVSESEYYEGEEQKVRGEEPVDSNQSNGEYLDQPIRITISHNGAVGEEMQEMLQKIYKSYRPQLQTEPYSIKVLMQYRSKDEFHFRKALYPMIQRIYQKPQRDVETALRLLIQIAQKVPEAGLTKSYAQIYQKIAKLEMKYGLDIPIQKMLPLSQLNSNNTTSVDDLFDNLKVTIATVCTHQNILKIAKLISLGFKRTSLEENIIDLFIKKVVGGLNRQKNEKTIAAEIKALKELISKLNVKKLIELSDGTVKKATSSELRKKLVQVLAQGIRQKGKGRDANELIARFK